jgi:hypothetical protein
VAGGFAGGPWCIAGKGALRVVGPSEDAVEANHEHEDESQEAARVHDGFLDAQASTVRLSHMGAWAAGV